GVAWWESKGYRVKLMPGALEQDGWHAGSPEVRAADLQTAFADPEIDAIQTMRGGYGSAQVIPLLDFDAIAETPKFFVGLSDITALHAALLARAGLATVYGPSLTMFGNPSLSPFTAERFLQVLAGETTGPVPEDRDRLTVIAIAGGGGGGGVGGGGAARWPLSRRLHLHDRHPLGARPQGHDLLLRVVQQSSDFN